jgi:hypothetical protein
MVHSLGAEQPELGHHWWFTRIESRIQRYHLCLPEFIRGVFASEGQRNRG